MANRRDFIKTGCLACMGLTGISTVLEACSTPLQIVRNTALPANPKVLVIPVSKFTADTKMVILRNDGLDNDILLVKRQDSYKALLMSCTHEGYALTPTANKIYCNAHGSQYDLDGNVTKEPSLTPLTQYKTELINNIIHLYLDQKI